jgi:hypothetical protein
LNVFENKAAFLFCNYDRTKALCHPGRGGKSEAPSLDRCRSNCANVARTDSQVLQMKIAAGGLRSQAASGLVPTPLAERLREKADTLSELAERHYSGRITTDLEET